MNQETELEAGTESEKASRWAEIARTFDYAFQPIVHIKSGVTYGVEALLRNYEEAGFTSIGEVFDTAFLEQNLYKLDLALRELAIRKFADLSREWGINLFYNFDNRSLSMPDYSPENTSRILKRHNIDNNFLCLEISERHNFDYVSETKQLLRTYKQQAFRIALDDFGSGFAGLQMLYQTEPDMIKIDRFFIEGIANDSRKKLFVSNIINLAHIMGILVIAEGIETDKEFFVCREIGCDLAQGFLIQHPVTDTNQIQQVYSSIKLLNRSDRRSCQDDTNLINKNLKLISPVSLDDSAETLVKYFRNNELGILPVVNKRQEPIGIIRESDLKTYIYSPYGFQLLQNKTSGRDLQLLLSHSPIADINSSAESILKIFSFNENAEGITITDKGEYLGFLSARALLHVLNEKNVQEARDQNPLTRLPGNQSIQNYFAKLQQKPSGHRVICYFDLDNFKPFNDYFGFRQGDRAILLFSEILQKQFTDPHTFIGHIGGDDFFLGRELQSREEWIELVSELEDSLARFRETALSMYDEETRQQNYISGKDREGKIRKFPLLTASCAVLLLDGDKNTITEQQSSLITAELKKSAKRSSRHIAVSSYRA